jgi:hypothetical protein
MVVPPDQVRWMVLQGDLPADVCTPAREDVTVRVSMKEWHVVHVPTNTDRDALNSRPEDEGDVESPTISFLCLVRR